jgi:hypothetical protein
MPHTITQLMIGTAVGLAMTAASVGIIGSAGAGSQVGRAEAITHETLVNRHTSPSSETEFRLGDHQQLKRLFVGH